MPTPIDQRDVTLTSGTAEPKSVDVHTRFLTLGQSSAGAINRSDFTSSSLSESSRHEVTIRNFAGAPIAVISWRRTLVGTAGSWTTLLDSRSPSDTGTPTLPATAADVQWQWSGNANGVPWTYNLELWVVPAATYTKDPIQSIPLAPDGREFGIRIRDAAGLAIYDATLRGGDYP